LTTRIEQRIELARKPRADTFYFVLPERVSQNLYYHPGVVHGPLAIPFPITLVEPIDKLVQGRRFFGSRTLMKQMLG
jgi:hypothetical protein